MATLEEKMASSSSAMATLEEKMASFEEQARERLAKLLSSLRAYEEASGRVAIIRSQRRVPPQALEAASKVEDDTTELLAAAKSMYVKLSTDLTSLLDTAGSDHFPGLLSLRQEVSALSPLFTPSATSHPPTSVTKRPKSHTSKAKERKKR